MAERRISRRDFLRLAAGGLVLAACGGAKGEEATQTPESFKPTPAESLIPTATLPTATETSTPTATTAKPIETATATPEVIIEVKKIPVSEIPAKMDQLVQWLNKLTPQDVAAVFPGHPEIQDQNVDVAKFNVEEPLRKSKEAFKQGDVEEGRKYLLEAAKFMSGFAFVADPKEGMPLTPDVKGQHDPLDKYIKNARPSQVWLDSMYLPVIKILVSTDNDYPSQVRVIK